MVVGLWLHLTERHDHDHEHATMEHDYDRDHDAHHQRIHLEGAEARDGRTHRHGTRRCDTTTPTSRPPPGTCTTHSPLWTSVPTGAPVRAVPMPMSDGRPLRGLAQHFLCLGATAFGGPAAHVAMLQQEVVRRWSVPTEEHLLDLLGATNLIIGSDAPQRDCRGHGLVGSARFGRDCPRRVGNFIARPGEHDRPRRWTTRSMSSSPYDCIYFGRRADATFPFSDAC
ncbi:MAG: chromate transporter [Polyangiales bacterium]